MRGILLFLLLGLLIAGCTAQKVENRKPALHTPKKFEDIRFVAKKYGLEERLPDLWEGIDSQIELSANLCAKSPRDCEKLYQILKDATLKGIEIISLMESKR